MDSPTGRPWGVVPTASRTDADAAYPERMVQWLVGEAPVRVLDLGVGDGEMTAALVAQDHDVVAVDTSAPALAGLAERFEVTVVQAGAERLPFSAGSFDVVVAAESFDSFDTRKALDEIARVLRTDGHLALVWNVRDQSVPWMRRLAALIGNEGRDVEAIAQRLPMSGLFSLPEKRESGAWKRLDRDGLLAIVAQQREVMLLGADERARVLAAATALYESYASGHNGLRMRYATRGFRAQVHKDALPVEHDHGDADVIFGLT